MSGTAVLGLSAVNGWLLTFSLAVIFTLGAGSSLRSAARESRRAAEHGEPEHRGIRRRAGIAIVIGPVLGLVCAALLSDVDGLVAVIGLGALALGMLGFAAERNARADRLAVGGSALAALAAVIAGASFGPTGVDALDVVLAFAIILLVTLIVDGQGNVDGLVAGIGTIGGLALFAIAAFAGQDGLAAVMAGLIASCFAFLAFNTRPASLFVGRGGRLAIGFVLATGALAVDPVSGTARDVFVPLIVLGMLLLDGTVVVLSRLRRRHPLAQRRSDHLIHRLVAIGWTRSEGVAALIVAQFLLSFIALFTARAVFNVWLGVGAAAVVLVALAGEAMRARLEREHAAGFSGKFAVVVGVIVVALVLATVPAALAANDVTDLMESGRSAASRGLSAARDGDTISALGDFHEATLTFQRAVDKLDSPLVAGALAVPGVASNVRAARTLAKVGADLAAAGESLAEAARPDELEVVDGRLPLEVVQQITPKLTAGSGALTSALHRVESVQRLPYLAAPVSDAIDKIHHQLAQSEREARHAADAAKLAPDIFGGKGPRRYLLVVQNNAESRGTGGFIGSYAIITAENGKLSVGPIERTNTWNQATRALDKVTVSAPADYLRRYQIFRPDTTLQNVNMSPDFPSVAQALMSLAPQAGVGHVDGVMAIDPVGLAALLELTGPVMVDGWPTPIDSGNVVNVTLRDAYEAFARTPERADFLGDVAKAAVDKATSGTLGKPAKIAQALGRAAHGGHLILAFEKPAEQQLAEQLGVAGQVRPVRSDALELTTSNAAGNKIDYYLQRSVDYRVALRPNGDATEAVALGDLTVQLDNTAPNSGLPEGVIGPFDPRFQAGEARNFFSLYSPLTFATASLNGQKTGVTPGEERGRNVYSLFVDTQSKQTSTVTAALTGVVKLHSGWYSLDVGHQPTLNADRVHVSVDVPPGWKIDRAPGMKKVFDRRASVNLTPQKSVTLRVHIVRAVDTWDIWGRLEEGQ